MDSKVNYTVIGLFIVSMLVVLVMTFFWMSTEKHGQKYKIYLVYLHEEVSGLAVQSLVRYNGVPVGYVQEISLDAKNPQLVKIELAISEKAPITTSTVASLNAQGITGIVFVGLSSETVNAPALQAEPGQQYPIIPSRPSLLMQLSEVLPEVTREIASVSNNINRVLDDQNRQAFRDTLENMAKVTDTLARNSDNLNESLVSLKTTLQNVSSSSKQLPILINSVQKSSRVVTDTFDNLSTQVVPSTEQLLLRLNRLTNNLTGVASELQQNPSIIIRGKTNAAPGPGEK